MKTKLSHVLVLACVCAVSSQLSRAHAQGTAFTYQGHLQNGGNPANGSYDLAFTLYTTNVTGSAIAGPVTNAAVAVTNGLFTTTVDFGNAYTGTSNWLAIAVRPNAASSFTALVPRQQLTPVPYSLYAANAASAGSVTAANISGAISTAQLPALTLANVNGTLPAHTAYTVSGYQNYTFNTPVLFVSNSATLGSVSPALRVVGFGDTASGVLSVSAQGTGLIAQFGNAAAWVASIDTNGLIAASGFSGDGNGLTGLNASQLSGGTVPLPQLPAAVVTNNAAGVALSGSFSGAFSGKGGGLTNLSVSVADIDENIRIVRGTIGYAVTGATYIAAGAGFTAVRNGPGDYTITYNTPFTDNNNYQSVVVTSQGVLLIPAVSNTYPTSFEVLFYDPVTEVYQDPQQFNFIVTGPQ